MVIHAALIYLGSKKNEGCSSKCRAFEGTRKTRNSAVTSQKPHRTRVFCGRFPRHAFKKYLQFWLYYRYLVSIRRLECIPQWPYLFRSRRRKRKLRKHTNVYGNTRAPPKMSERTRSLPSRSHESYSFVVVSAKAGSVVETCELIYMHFGDGFVRNLPTKII